MEILPGALHYNIKFYYLQKKRASTSIYFDSTSTSKGVKGGFAVGGYNSGKAGEPNQMMALTRENYFIGDEAGAAITQGRFNTFFGYKSGKSTTAGYRNVFLGYWTGTNNTTGANNVFIGNESGAFNVEGINNVFLGAATGRSSSAGNRNVFIGNALFLVDQVNGVYFNWKTEELEHKGFNNSRQIGFIAQEVETILPELVATDEDGYKSVDYSKVTAVLIQAVKEQQVEIEMLKAENAKYASLDEKVRVLEEKLKILDNLAEK